MLQFITNKSDRFSIEEEVQMVLEGGCKWIQLNLNDVDDTEARDIALEIIPLCKENEAFLIIEDRVELARELGVYGVHLNKSIIKPAEAREQLGPEAIIGVSVTTADDITALRGIDVDYVSLGPFANRKVDNLYPGSMDCDYYRSIIKDVRSLGIELPVVATGEITAEDISNLLAAGVSGIALSEAITDAEDPVAYTEKCLGKLSQE